MAAASLRLCGIDFRGRTRKPRRYASWDAPQPAWSAFRESSFGVGSLDVLNATHAKYAWHRDACGAAAAPYYDLDAAGCATPKDDGGAPHVAIDAVVLSRAHRASAACAAARRAPPPVTPFPRRAQTPKPRYPVPASERERDAAARRTVELSIVAALVGTAASFLLGVAAAVFGQGRRPSKCRRASVETVTLVDKKRFSPVSVFAPIDDDEAVLPTAAAGGEMI